MSKFNGNFGQTDIKVTYDGKDITQLVNYVEWSGDIKQASRQLDVFLFNTVDGRKQAIDFVKGKEIVFSNDGLELFRGLLFRDDINSRGEMYLTAYDENIYLTKSRDTRKFKNKKASDIIKRLCDDFGVAYGTITDTQYVIPKLILRDRTLWEMIITALTVTEKQTGKRFFIVSKNGKLSLLERKEQISKWVLENGTNIIDANYSQTIENTKTQVKVVSSDSDKNPIIATVKDDDLISNLGIMQHLESADSDLTKSQIEQRAKELLNQLGTIEDTATLDCLGLNDVISGSAVYVKEQMTGIVGSYYVTNDVHTFENGNHKMNVTLSATDDLPKMEYEEVEE